jgi:hypothetical protein
MTLHYNRNAEVHEQLDAVVDQIAIAVQRRSQPPLAPPCYGGETTPAA